MNIITVTAALFCVGLYGVLTRRDIIGVLASVELMLGAANLQLVAFGAADAAAGGPAGSVGQVIGLIVLVLAAAEAAVGLAILVTLVRHGQTDKMDELVEVQG